MSLRKLCMAIRGCASPEILRSSLRLWGLLERRIDQPGRGRRGHTFDCGVTHAPGSGKGWIGDSEHRDRQP
jgi:hypothetical protein